MNTQNFRFIFFIYFVLFGILIVCFGSFVGYRMNITDIDENIDKAAQEIGFIKKTDSLKPDVEKFDQVVKALSHSSVLNDYILHPTHEKQIQLTDVFYTITMSNQLIMQARFLDEQGFERIRIDRKNKNDLPFIIPTKELQDKSQRDYFQIVSHLTSEQIWHSKIDLNMEHKKIEIPYKPTFRVAQPIFIDQKFKGMVIANIAANEMIEGLQRSSAFYHYVIDKDGYFILHSDEHYSWSRYTHSNKRLYDEFPDEAEKILSGTDKGQTFYSFRLNDILNNDDNAILVLKPKETYKASLLSSNVKTTFLIIFLSILISVPLAFFASMAPSKLQKTLLSANEELKRVAKIIDTYVITAITQSDSIIKSVSTSFMKNSGYSREELIGERISIIHHPDTPKEVITDLWRTIQSGKSWQGELKNLRKDGTFYYLDQTILPIRGENNEILNYMSIGIDITAKKEAERLAEIDKLTNIYNRRKLDEYMDVELERAKRYQTPLSFMVFDIDFFKKINDTYGHTTGDLTLQTLAKILQDTIRKSDILGRYGGEEFVVICPETTGDSANILAEKVRSFVENYDFPEVKHMTISIGIASYQNELTKEDLFSRADKALYEAKETGRNRVVLA